MVKYMPCKNRVKPKLLRDVKTEALLVFIRTTLEQSFNELEGFNFRYCLEKEEDNKVLFDSLDFLLNNLQDTVINSSYLRSLIEIAVKNPALRIAAKKEEPLMVYYDSLVKTIEKSLPKGSIWIPELVIISLLSEWIIEEEKSTYFYPYLNQIDYLDLMNRYELTKMNDSSKKDLVLNMYKLSSELINRLKKVQYKINHKKYK